jgi:hypothetical protein
MEVVRGKDVENRKTGTENEDNSTEKTEESKGLEENKYGAKSG